MEREALQAVVRDGIAGAIIWYSGDATSEQELARLNAAGVPMVFVDRYPTAFDCDFVGIEVHGDAHSHIDAIGHCAYQGALYHGAGTHGASSRGVTHGAIDVAEHGIVGRGVLIDIPPLHGVPWLEPGAAVFTRELEAAAAAAGVRVGSGDILLLRTGHHRRRLDLGPWDAAVAKAGLHPSAMPWLHAREVAALGADGDGDCVPSPAERMPYPIHTLGIVAMGVHFLDSLQFEELAAACAEEGRWEFLCVIAPLRLRRGTGSPVNPIAIF
jgi:kynurenine formamidase